MRRKISVLLLVGLVVLVGIFAFKQTKENKQYENYLSLKVFNDYSEMAFNIIQGHKYYNEILESGRISAEHLRFLIESNSNIKMNAQDYQLFAIDINRLDGEEVSNLTSNNAASTGIYFFRLASQFAEELGVYNEETYGLYPVDLLSNESFELDKDMIKDITMIRDLNQEWVDVLVENIEGVSEHNPIDHSSYTDAYFDKTIEKDFWGEVLVELEKATEKFLKEQHIVQDIGTLFN